MCLNVMNKLVTILCFICLLATSCSKVSIDSMKVGDYTHLEECIIMAKTRRGIVITDRSQKSVYVYGGPDFNYQDYDVSDVVDVSAGVTLYNGMIELQNPDIRVVSRNTSVSYPLPLSIDKYNFMDFMNSGKMTSEYISCYGRLVTDNNGARYFVKLDGTDTYELELEFPVHDLRDYLGQNVAVSGYYLFPSGTGDYKGLKIALTQLYIR